MPRTERTVPVGGITITVRTSDRATLDVTVTKRGDIIVHGPHGTTDTDAAALVERRHRWIYQQLTRLAETTPDNPVKELATGEKFTILGRPHRLRIVPDNDQSVPLTQAQDTATGDWLHLRRGTATNPNRTRRTMINLYAETGQEWLKVNRPQIATYLTNRDLPLAFSTRMHTTWTRHHPDRGPTLHWATAQLPPALLRELIHRTLKLHTVADHRALNDTLRGLWTGRLTPPNAPDQHTSRPPAQGDHCPDCSAPPGTLHADRCDIARCALTGLQRGNCHPVNTCNTVWTGQIPGEAECIEYGFYYRDGTGIYEPCNADDPHAQPDLNRLYRECRWDVATQRMTLRTM